MNVGTAIRNSIPVPFEDEKIMLITMERGIDFNAEFTRSLATSKEFLLSKADALRMLLMMPNVSEGGVSISWSDRKHLAGVANRIYAKFGEEQVQTESPSVEPLDW